VTAPDGSVPLLDVRDLSVRFHTEDGEVRAVDDVSFSIRPGETLGVVGESGSGKSVTFLAVMGLLDRDTARISGRITFGGVDLLGLAPSRVRQYRGTGIGMVFQDPLSALNPAHRVGDQIGEVFRTRRGMSKREARAEAVELLRLVGIPHPERRARQWPHEFSGGMRQRVVIAIALALRPQLLIADEPTTALDVTVQAQILDLIDRLRAELGTAVVLITHDLGIVAEHCDRTMVMYAGRVVESGSGRDIFYRSRHPYTWGLLQSISRLDWPRSARLRPIDGQPPSLIEVPPGCAFHPRCPFAIDPTCWTDVPALERLEAGHAAACHLPAEERERVFRESVLHPERAGEAV
jgi:peptide/nickel transport system ATP-binding protein